MYTRLFVCATLFVASTAYAQCGNVQECQPLSFDTAYASSIPIAESVTFGFNGRIRTVCIEGIFINTDDVTPCPPSDEWNLNVYRDDADFPGIQIYTYEAGGGADNMTVTSTPTGGSFGGFPLYAVSLSDISVPVDLGGTYHFEVTDDNDNCVFHWVTSDVGDGKFLHDIGSDGYDAGDAFDGDLTICFGASIGSPCSLADVTTQGAGPGTPLDGVADGIVSAADINLFVNGWVNGDLGLADITSQGSGPQDPLYGIPDGNISGADINFYVNAWIPGCN